MPIQYEVRDENDPVGQIAQQTASALEADLVKALFQMQNSGLTQLSNQLYVATMAISSAINVAAKLMSFPETRKEAERWSEGPVDRQVILAACLLVARCTKPAEDGSLDFQFGPSHILAAILAAEKVVGRSNDSLFTKPMVEAARSQEVPTHFFDNSDDPTADDLSKYRTLN